MKSPKGKSKAPFASSSAGAASAAVEEEKQPIVWKGATRAKKLFKLFDHDKDKVLNRAEFSSGLVGFVNGPDLAPLTSEQVDALWLETDLNKDEKVSWAEFQYRFCGGPNPLTTGKKAEKKLSLHLQTPRKKEPLTGKNSAVSQLRSVLEAVYDGPKPRYKGVDLTKTKQLNAPGLKKLLSQVLAEEKADAKAKKRPLDEWAAPLVSTGVDTKTCDKLFFQLDTSKSGKVDLTQFFDQLKLRPATGKPGGAKSKKKKKVNLNPNGPQAYTLTTVKPEHVRDFVSELLLKHMPDNVGHSVKCHPPLKHWGDDERKRKGLNTEGYKTTIFLSERTKIKAVVKLAPPPPAEPTAPSGEEKENHSQAQPSAHRPPSSPTKKKPSSAASSPMRSPASSSRGLTLGSPSAKAAAAAAAAAAAGDADPVNHSDILVFAAYRTEYTAMARSEFLWHARLTLDEDENLKQVEIALRMSWVDGEIDKNNAGTTTSAAAAATNSSTTGTAGETTEAAFDNWIAFVGHEDAWEEMSIPPIA